jgi:glyoxylase-like metal-dependent hydrolase (beta-lactamase superfamily II)
MERVVEGPLATAPEPLPFGRSMTLRAFLCHREAGNILIYATPALAAEAAEIERLGGVWRHYLGHGHEAGFLAMITDAGATLIHERDVPERAGPGPQPATFADEHEVGPDFQIIPAPGHTPGTTAYLWGGPRERVLFTADTVFLRDGDWQTALLSSSDRAQLIESLELIRELEFDVLAPWIAGAGQACWARTDRRDTHRRIDAILRRIRGDQAQ